MSEATENQRLIDLVTGDDEVMVAGDLVINKDRTPQKKANPWQSFLLALALALAGLAVGLGLAGLFDKSDPNYGEFELLPPESGE